jgi:hypothetical protein
MFPSLVLSCIRVTDQLSQGSVVAAEIRRIIEEILIRGGF